MKKHMFGIAEGGAERLRKAIELRLRQRYEQELAAAEDHWQKVAIEDEIRKEVEDEMKRIASPHSLWNSD